MGDTPARVAILDDDPPVRRALTRLLKASQMRPRPFAHYLELFKVLERETYDCLVLDLQMPAMNGLEVMRYLASRDIQLPVVIITGHDTAGSREACLAAGAVAYLVKPTDGEELVRLIQDVVGDDGQKPRES